MKTWKLTIVVLLLQLILEETGILAMNTNGNRLKQMKIKEWSERRERGDLSRRDLRSVRSTPQTCDPEVGSVRISTEDFPCFNIDFNSFISLSELTFELDGLTDATSDIWGWVDPDGREITLLCVTNGIWFIDTTDPNDPKKLARMNSTRGNDPWCDVKVFEDTAYVVKDNSRDSSPFPEAGIQVFDLTRLENLTGDEEVPPSLAEDFLYGGHRASHNLVINTETGYLYSVGTTTCSGGLHVLNLNNNSLRPEFEGCIDTDGYTHDAQCVIYRGPDSRFEGLELCFAFNEDTLTIWNVEDKLNPEIISRTSYLNVAYTHQGWLTADMNYLLLDDELDEASNEDKQTVTFVVNIIDMKNPVFEYTVIHEEEAIDHNLYFWGPIHENGWGGNPPVENPPLPQYAYLSNYVAGIKVLDMSGIASEEVKVAGFFDVSPDIQGIQFEGAWSNYMHPSGVLVVSSIERGLFVLSPRMAFQTVEGFAAETSPLDDLAGSDVEVGLIVAGCVIVVVGLLLVGIVTRSYIRRKKMRQEA